eukprot:250502-Chlamydomonas_euryale.AAC.18
MQHAAKGVRCSVGHMCCQHVNSQAQGWRRVTWHAMDYTYDHARHECAGSGCIGFMRAFRRSTTLVQTSAPASSTAHVEAGTTESAAALNTRCLQAQLPGLDRGNVAARTAADDDDVLLLRCGCEATQLATEHAPEQRCGGLLAAPMGHRRAQQLHA